MKKKVLALTLAVALSSCQFLVQKNNSNISDLQKVHEAANVKPHPRQLAWQQLEMTAFFHFGINTFTGREWGNGAEDPQLFLPTELDCRQWIRSVKAAGFKLAILTAKHHDGFCLWPSRYTDHDVASSSYKDGKGDVVAEFMQACRDEGMKIGIYLSPWDRHEKSYGTQAYNDYFDNQIREIFETYGNDIDEFWFDGAVDSDVHQLYDWNRFYKTIREKNPDCVIAICGPDVRWVGNESGLARESEWSVVPASVQNQEEIAADFKAGGFHYTRPDKEIQLYQFDTTSARLGDRSSISQAEELIWYPAECDTSIRPGWFYHESQDSQVKSLSQLMDIYYRSVGRNSVLLLNIPPDKRGLVHENDVKRLQEFGKTISALFADNLAAAAVRTDSPVDGDDFQMTVELDLGKPQQFNRLSIAENIADGQRVEKFVLEVWNGRSWKEVVRSTTIGYKRLLKFRKQEAQKVRIRIEQARSVPQISSIGLYNSPRY